MRALVVNYIGGPGVGKSTNALLTSGFLKMMGVNAEYVHEFAKDLVYENRTETLLMQPYVTAKQYKKIAVLKDQVDVIITDSPFITGLAYPTFGTNEFFEQWLISVFEQFNNYNVLLKRSDVLEYEPDGRVQKTKEEAVRVDLKIKGILEDKNLEYETVQVFPGLATSLYVAQNVLERLGRPQMNLDWLIQTMDYNTMLGVK